MTNDTREGNKEDVVPCFALSKNDSYVMSASGGKISLFNMMTFKVPPCPTHVYSSAWLQTLVCSLFFFSDDDDIHGASSSSDFPCLPSSRQ